MIGLISYGTYIPRYRLKTEDIATTWEKNPEDIVRSLGIQEKSVAGIDEDAVTMAIEASTQALHRAFVEPKDIETIFVGSESHPYAVNPTSTIVGEFLGLGNNYLAADFQFACKAATSAMQAIAGLVESGRIKTGMSIGSDVAQSRPHDALEYTSASAAVACIIGRDTDYPLIAELLDFTSFSSDTPDFWRRDGIRYPSHAGRFTGEPSYFAHVMGAASSLMKKTQTTPDKITHCVFHMPNGKFPRDVARRLGFSREQVALSLTVDAIGNPYSASCLLGFSQVLDYAKEGDTIFMVSYGSGAGSDAFLWKVTKEIQKRDSETVKQQIERKKYINYVQYLKQTHKL